MRLKVLKIIVLFFFLFLILGLAYIQIIRGPYYSRLSQNNRIKLVSLSAARGLIFDREGQILAGKKLVFNVALLLQEVKDTEQTLKQISPILNIPEEELLHQFKKNFLNSFTPVVISRDISKELAIILECKEADIPGLLIQTEPARDYQYGESFCHLLGYLGRISEEELRRFKTYGLRTRDLVGRSGAEEQFDQYLRGKSGGMQVEVNNRGYQVRVLGLRNPQSGENLYLTINVKLQQLAYTLLEKEKGVCIVMNPQNGEILALVSRPGFDPNLFISALYGKQKAADMIKRLFSSDEASLFNRAISGAYPPGSIFKIAVAAAGLETGVIDLQDRLFCSGSINVGNREFFCWNLDGHGAENIYSAIAHSCNVFFYKLGLKLGPDRIYHYARKFGLGSPTKIDLPYEACGFVPCKSWKQRAKKERWYDGETANFSIGQGCLLVTPLQIARMVAAVANGGYLVKPHILKQIGTREGDFVKEKLDIKTETIEVVKEGMRQAIQERGGTGYRANIPGLQWAAKTGTAQTSIGQAHSWFGGFYPLNNPGIVVVVFLEYGGSGGERSALIAKRIIEFIKRNNEDEI